ncbi:MULTISPECIES: hypothetical protein [Okeania]
MTNLSTNNCLKFFEIILQPLQPDGILIVGVDSNQN